MNRRMLCKFEVASVEQVLAARLNQEEADLLSVNISDRGKLTGPEQMVLRQFIALARTVLVAPTITVEQVNTFVSQAGCLVELLARPRRKHAPPQNHLPIFGSEEWPDGLDDYALALTGIHTGTCYDFIAQRMWDA